MDAVLIQMFSFGIFTCFVGILLIPKFIEFLQIFKLWKQIREKATIWRATEFLRLHKKKAGTPTMWGAVILGIVFLMVFVSLCLEFFWVTNNSLLNQKETYLSLFTLATVGFLWWVDDYMNIRWIGRTKWLSARFKMMWLLIFAFLWALWFYFKLDWWMRDISLPVFGEFQIWVWFIILFIFIIVATANSVNLTDGLDGLAGGLLLFAYAVYAYITFDQGLFLLSTLCVTIVGALIAFLWFNVKPAKFYMWDIWSLSLGANLGIMAMLTNTVFVLVIVGAIFIFETLSVIIQLTSKKLRKGKKVFRIAPFHHHLEAIGWSEETVVFRLWLIGAVLSVVGIIVYKLQ